MGCAASVPPVPAPAAPKQAASEAATAGSSSSSRLTTGVTLAFLRDLPAVIAKLAGGFPHALTTEQLFFGRSEHNATGPGPIDWCIFGVTGERDDVCVRYFERAAGGSEVGAGATTARGTTRTSQIGC
jgi:hypothetical protein